MAVGQLRASQELGLRLRERPTWDKVTTHYAALPHFVVLNGLNKCNNKTVSQALKYNYRKIIFCSLYVNRSTASGECVPDRDPDTHPASKSDSFFPRWQIFCASQSHFLLRTFTHSHTHSIIRTSLSYLPLLDLASHLSLCAICHTAFPRMLCSRHLACINSGLRSLAEKWTSVMHFAPLFFELECEEGRRGEERFIWFGVLLRELLSLNHKKYHSQAAEGFNPLRNCKKWLRGKIYFLTERNNIIVLVFIFQL